MTNSKNTFTFNGFEPANTTPVPDVLFDVLLPYLNEAQLKVMLYIIRRTLGFKKTSDAISLNQFRRGITTKDGKKLDDGCGLKNFTTISKALKELEQMNCIESDKRETDEGNNLTTVYRIRFRGTTPNVVGTTDNVVGVLRQTYDRTTSSGGRVLRQTEPQETVRQQTDSQETVRQERERIPAPESHAPTVAPPDVGALALPSKTEAFIEKLREWRIEDEQPEEDITQAETVKVQAVSKQNTSTPTPAQAPSPQSEQAALGQCSFCPEEAELTCRVCGKHVCYFEHGRRFPLSETEVEDYCLPCLEAHNAAVTKALRQKESAQQNHSAGSPCGAMVTPEAIPQVS